MIVQLNGEPVEMALVDDTIAGLLALLGAVPERVAVEQNGAIVKRAERATTHVKPGDVIEVVTLVGGG
jgi:thiamine biosynthesis protein ThiS